MNVESYLKADSCFRQFEMIEKLKKISKDREVVFLCVGNPKIWFDSFGPIMGSLFRFLNIEHFVYGNINCPIISSNLEEYISMIYRFHIKPYVVVLDNAISNIEYPCVKIKEGTTKCACLSEAVEVGDMSILYCLNQKQMKDSSNYKGMLSCVKSLGRMMKFVFQNDKL